MNPDNNNPPQFPNKHGKNRASFTESANGANSSTSSNAREPKIPAAGTSASNTWYEGHREHRREHKNRDRSHDRDWTREKERRSHSRSRENFHEEESRDKRFREDAQAYPNFAYNPPADPSYVDNGQRNDAVANYGMYAAMNPNQWGMPQMEGMNPPAAIVNPPAAINQPAAMNVNNPAMEINMPAAAAGMNPYAYLGMPPDPNMFGMIGIGNYGQYGIANNEWQNVAPKNIVHFSKSVLYPPNPNAVPPSTRDKPPGCKTIFVGGLPENITEEILREIFKGCGEIATVRMSKKNFCHIRFTAEHFIENALFYSGYRIKIENKDDAPNTGRLHVDYAQARDDQYEYECRQRSLQREARHRERMEQEYFRQPTPPPIVHYSDHEATVLGEKLRNEDTFQQAITTLQTWLERGECNKRNAGFFYSMIQSTNSHVRRLMNEKLKYEEELNRAKLMLKQQMQGILVQFNEIEKIFTAASLQKVWDHFTKAQRKNIELWKKQTEEIKNAHVEEVLNDRVEDEMDVSDGEGEEKTESVEGAAAALPGTSGADSSSKNNDQKMQEESDNLRCQLEAAENELILVKSEADQERELRNRQLDVLREGLHKMQDEVDGYAKKSAKDDADLKEFRAMKQKETKSENETEVGECSHEGEENKEDNVEDMAEATSENDIEQVLAFASSIASTSGTQHDARLICLISTFLNVHPFGASVDYICSFLHQIDSRVRARDVETLMRRFPSVFKEESTGIGASLEKKWNFCGFNPEN